MRFLRASRSPGAIRCCLARNDRHFVNGLLSRAHRPLPCRAASAPEHGRGVLRFVRLRAQPQRRLIDVRRDGVRLDGSKTDQFR